MKTNKVLNKVALAFALLAVIAFVIAISPAILTILLALVAFFIAAFGLIVIVLGGFIALFTLPSGNTGVWDSVWALTSGSWAVAGGIFGIIPPMAEFCFTSHMSQICAGIGMGIGIVGLIMSIVAMSVKAPQDEEGEDGYVEPVAGQAVDSDKKKKAKKPKTDRSVSIACLVVSIIFTLLNGVAMFAIDAMAKAYFAA